MGFCSHMTLQNLQISPLRLSPCQFSQAFDSGLFSWLTLYWLIALYILLWSCVRCYVKALYVWNDMNGSCGVLQVAEGRGNCTWHRNPTPCIIPQDKENIFHTIFAFFTKSGRKVLVSQEWISSNWKIVFKEEVVLRDIYLVCYVVLLYAATYRCYC